MASDLIFYTNPMSRGRIIRWMLEEVGEPYETVILEWGNAGQFEDYRKINPMAKIPAIVHAGRVVTEAAAICAYLAEAFPKAGLAPTAEERADYYRWLFFTAGPAEAAMVNNTLGWHVPPDMQRMVGYGSYDRMVDVLEQAVSARPYICGDRFTAADVYVGSQIGWGTGVGSLPRREAFAAYVGRVTSRPAWKRAQEIDGPIPGAG
ncbi:glutathione S-transferase [Caulobacter ginsengisoli]|uniref:Glutathione S-transferase n=1 Tax=Caulobacter ginsengisoli TaxID=400775 RepID=A0ABU0IS71_9CAUL|nr:glutathione S-transferase family protein [Caulobacter ginsengisoli]MDQ0464008.1 glutathione S-transferase [Caulobacter ginsengisoli]